MSSRNDAARSLLAEAAALETRAEELRSEGRHAEAFELEHKAHNARFDAEYEILACGETPEQESPYEEE